MEEAVGLGKESGALGRGQAGENGTVVNIKAGEEGDRMKVVKRYKLRVIR